MHDAPSIAVKQKKRSSMRVCFDLLKAKEVTRWSRPAIPAR